mgnify:CR=1 FL=1
MWDLKGGLHTYPHVHTKEMKRRNHFYYVHKTEHSGIFLVRFLKREVYQIPGPKQVLSQQLHFSKSKVEKML